MSVRYTCLWLTVRVSAGGDIDRAAADMISLTKRLGCNVETRFNGIKLLVTERSTAEEIVAEYYGGFGTWRDVNRADNTNEAQATGEPAP